MQFLVIGKDGKDEKALERRMAVREAHLELGDEMEKSGERWYGCAILDDAGEMIGSMAVMDFPTEKALQAWLDREPYVVGKRFGKPLKFTNVMLRSHGNLIVLKNSIKKEGINL